MNTASLIPSEISQSVLEPMGVVSWEPLRPGMSGAKVFRCLLRSGEQRLLKRWPEETAAERIAEVDRVVRYSREHACELTPRLYPVTRSGDTFRWVQQAYWQVMEWMPGEPLAQDCELALIERGAEAIATFHLSVTKLGVNYQPAHAVAARLQRAKELSPLVSQVMGMGPDSVLEGIDPAISAALFEARQLVIWNWDAVAQKISRALTPYLDEPVCNQYVLRDVHRENAFFLNGNPSGLIDFDAVRMDTPWTDLARWTGSFLGGPHDPNRVWDAAMAGFGRNHPLNQSQEMEFGHRLARELSYATTWIGLANWLVWLIVERRSFDVAPQVVAARIEELRLQVSR